VSINFVDQANAANHYTAPLPLLHLIMHRTIGLTGYIGLSRNGLWD